VRDLKRQAKMVQKFNYPYLTTTLKYPQAWRVAVNPNKPADFEPSYQGSDSVGFWRYEARHANESLTQELNASQEMAYSAADLEFHIWPGSLC
jgi:hypothetical protein